MPFPRKGSRLQFSEQDLLSLEPPTHGSWLNLIENQFSKMTRTMLRGIRVASKQELMDRIHQLFVARTGSRRWRR